MNPVLRLSGPANRQVWEIVVVYEDDDLLVLDKPALLPTCPDPLNSDAPSLMTLLHQEIARGARWAVQRQLTYLANSHRLDAGTSGVLLLAKNKNALCVLNDQFGSGKPLQIHLALAQGCPTQKAFASTEKLAPHPKYPGRVRVDPRHGKKSITEFEVTHAFDGYCLLRCRLQTSRSHQVRVHLQNLGFPVVGDTLYGGHPLLLSRLKSGYRLKPGATERPLMQRSALHAQRLDVIHPGTLKPLSFVAPLPDDFVLALKYLHKLAAGEPSRESTRNPQDTIISPLTAGSFHS